MTIHSGTRLQKSKHGKPRHRRRLAATARARKKRRALRLEPLEIRTLLSADVFDAVLGGPVLLDGDPTSEPVSELNAGELTQDGASNTETPEARSLCYDYEYVIITNDALKSSFQPLLEQKQSRGLTGRIVTTESIYASYSGTESGDNADNRPIRPVMPFPGTWIDQAGSACAPNGAGDDTTQHTCARPNLYPDQHPLKYRLHRPGRP